MLFRQHIYSECLKANNLEPPRPLPAAGELRCWGRASADAAGALVLVLMEVLGGGGRPSGGGRRAGAVLAADACRMASTAGGATLGGDAGAWTVCGRGR
jgi:hypothetical protein